MEDHPHPLVIHQGREDLRSQPSVATPEPCCRYLQVAIPNPTDRILRQGRARVRAIEALGTIEPTGPFERTLARLLVAAYKRRCVVS
jgi:hypothetical protein